MDSGAIYRVIGYLAGKKGIRLTDVDGLVGLAENLNLEFRNGSIWVDGEEIGDEIRTEDAALRASQVAPLQPVREKLFQWQRSQAKPPGLVADGRDMGTVVFPESKCKLFVTASTQARAERRFKQLRDKGFDVNIAQLFKEISERDERDVNRPVSPLKPAEDAIQLDTTNMSVEQVMSQVMALVEQKLGIRAG
jgi:cytidylate kinase